MGHLNFYHPEAKQLAIWLAELDLPPASVPARDWALARLGKMRSQKD